MRTITAVTSTPITVTISTFPTIIWSLIMEMSSMVHGPWCDSRTVQCLVGEKCHWGTLSTIAEVKRLLL